MTLVMKFCHLIIVLLSVIIVQAEEYYFNTTEVKTIICYYCINKTSHIDECKKFHNKYTTCTQYESLLNKNDIRGYVLLKLKYKCARVVYSSEYLFKV